jgi:diacylglycerol kinase family enzyme
LAFASTVRCTVPEVSGNEVPSNIYVEADGELLGTLPAEITVVPDALSLLIPER